MTRITRTTLAFAVLSLCFAVPARAQTPPTTTTPAERFANLDRMLAQGALIAPQGAASLPSTAEMGNLLQRYQGTTAAFSQYWATTASQPLDVWLTQNSQRLTSALALPQITATSSASMPTSSQLLQEALSKSGFAASPTASWTTYAKDVQRDPLAAPIVARSMDFATRAAQMRMPDTAALTASLSTAGLLAERSITAMVTDHPDLISQVQSGVLSPASQAAWKKSMKAAATASLPNVTDGLIDPCQASMLWAMGSGSASGARAIGGKSCSPCISQGLYMHESMNNLITKPQNSTSSVIPPSDFNMIPEWRRSAIVSQNPKTVSTPSFAVGSNTCNAKAQGAAQRVVQGTLGGLRAGK
jgi:hypothetical protein